MRLLSLALVALIGVGCPLPAGLKPRDFITDARFTTLVVELDGVPGKNDDDDVYARLRRLADQDALHKPGGVRFDGDDDEEDCTSSGISLGS